MKIFLQSCSIVFLFLVGPALVSCTNDDEKQEKGQIEQFTDRTAEKAVDYMKTPLDKAREAAKKANERNKAMQEAEKRAN